MVSSYISPTFLFVPKQHSKTSITFTSRCYRSVTTKPNRNQKRPNRESEEGEKKRRRETRVTHPHAHTPNPIHVHTFPGRSYKDKQRHGVPFRPAPVLAAGHQINLFRFLILRLLTLQTHLRRPDDINDDEALIQNLDDIRIRIPLAQLDDGPERAVQATDTFLFAPAPAIATAVPGLQLAAAERAPEPGQVLALPPHHRRRNRRLRPAGPEENRLVFSVLRGGSGRMEAKGG